MKPVEPLPLATTPVLLVALDGVPRESRVADLAGVGVPRLDTRRRPGSRPAWVSGSAPMSFTVVLASVNAAPPSTRTPYRLSLQTSAGQSPLDCDPADRHRDTVRVRATGRRRADLHHRLGRLGRGGFRLAVRRGQRGSGGQFDQDPATSGGMGNGQALGDRHLLLVRARAQLDPRHDQRVGSLAISPPRLRRTAPCCTGRLRSWCPRPSPCRSWLPTAAGGLTRSHRRPTPAARPRSRPRRPTLLTTRTADRTAGPRDPRRNNVVRMGTLRLHCVDAPALWLLCRLNDVLHGDSPTAGARGARPAHSVREAGWSAPCSRETLS